MALKALTKEKPLELEATLGFGGNVNGGLHVHPDRENLIYPLGCSLIVQRIGGKQTQQFLHGHTETVTCVAVSPTGRFVASGQTAHPGHPADIIVWDYKAMKELYRFKLHKGRVHSLAFSPGEKFLASLGGPDDGALAIWDLGNGKAVCGSPTAPTIGGNAEAVSFARGSDTLLVTGGVKTMRSWELDLSVPRLKPSEISLRGTIRTISCIAVSADDEFVYAGTTSGDIVQIQFRTRVFKGVGPPNSKFSGGVVSLSMLKNGDLVAGGGEGFVALLKPATWKTLKSTQVEGGATSIALRGDGQEFFVGTSRGNVYRAGITEFAMDLRSSSHFKPISHVEFPMGTSELFVTSSYGEIRLWGTASNKEMLRINVPNVMCNMVVFSPDGKLILSAWEDGIIRAFLPQSGKLKFEILNAHQKGVTAIAWTHDSTRVISGGGDGQVRVWKIGAQTQTLVESMKEHRGAVTSIKVRHDDQECVSSSVDGTCMVWSLTRFVRLQMLMATSMFKEITFSADEAQLLTGGSDHKVAYWEYFDGSLIREIPLSTGTINGLDVSPDGSVFAMGGDDALVKVILYNEGLPSHIGKAHSAPITSVKICPLRKYILSVSADGGICRWSFPK